MKALQCRGIPFALVLTLSGCAGDLDGSLNYGTPAPDASVARAGEAGRAPVADAGARMAQAGRAPMSMDKPAMNNAGNSGTGNTSMNKPGSAAPQDQGGEDAGASQDMEMEMEMEMMTQKPAAPACDFPAIMQAKCGNASCHGAPGSSTGLDLTTAMLAARVDGRKGKGACTDKLLVDVDNPRQSKLYLKVSGTTCGSQMPLGGMLTQDEQACVLTWIEKL